LTGNWETSGPQVSRFVAGHSLHRPTMKTRVGCPDDIWTVRIWTVKIGLGFESGLGLVLVLVLGLGLVIMTVQILTGKVNRKLV